MGVDITLQLEIERQGQWHRLSLASTPLGRKEDSDSLYLAGYTCRYYHFEPFISEAPSLKRNDPSVLCEEARLSLAQEKPGTNLGFGVFLFEDLASYCQSLEKELLRVLSQSELFELRKQMDRIEDLLLNAGGHKGPSRLRPERERECQSLEDIYEDFMGGTKGVVLEYWRGVCALPLIIPNLNLEKLRFFYTIW